MNFFHPNIYSFFRGRGLGRVQNDSYEPLAKVHNWTNEDGESRQQTHYFHCDQIGIPREMTDKDGNLVWGLLRLGQTEERNQHIRRNCSPTLPPAKLLLRP